MLTLGMSYSKANEEVKTTLVFKCPVYDSRLVFTTISTDVDDTGAGAVWVLNSNMFADDGAESRSIMSQTATESMLNYCSGFGFVVPSAATVLGIQVEVERRNIQSGPAAIMDRRIVLFDDTGTAIGSNKAATTDWAGTIEKVSYGGHNDLWGSAWTPAQINSMSFGAGVAATFYNAATATGVASGRLDYMKIRIVAEVCGTTVEFIHIPNPMLAHAGRLMVR